MEIPNKDSKTSNVIIPVVLVLAAAALGFVCYKLGQQSMSTECHVCDYSKETFRAISPQTAQTLANNYKQICQPALNALLPDQNTREDARSAQFPLLALKSFIWQLEARTCGIDSLRNLGIRFYYGRYPDISALVEGDPLYTDLHDVNPDYSFLHTLFLVPTYHGSDGVEHDLNMQSDLHAHDGPMLIMNHSNLSPPPFLVTDPALAY